MDFDLGEQATALRSRLRELIATHIAEDYLGAFTERPRRPGRWPSAFCKTLADEGLLTIAWPAEYGGGGGLGLGPDRRARGDVGPPRAPRRAVHGPQLGRAGDHGLRHRGAEAAAPRRHRRRRGHLVPGLQRARGRLGPGLAAHPGRPRTATAGASAARRSGPPTPAWPSGASWRPGSGRASATRASRCSSSRWTRPGITVRPIRSMLGLPPPQRGVLRRRARRPRRRARRHRRRLGRHPQGAGPRAGRHRPLRPLRAAAVGARQGAGPALGRPARLAARRVGPGPRAGAGGPPAGLPHRARPGRPASCPTSTPRRPASR